MSELAHSEAEGLFSAYVDQELPPPELERFVAHVESCEGCMEGLERFERTVEQVRGVPRAQAPTAFTRQVMRRVKQRKRRTNALLDGSIHLPAEAVIPIILAAAIALLIHALQ